MNLRPYQLDVLARHAASRARAALIVMPTGAGKTVVFAQIAADEPGRVLVVAHRRELIRQAHAKIPGSSLYPSAMPARVQVGSIQTLQRHVGRLPRYARIILDEAHHAVAPGYKALLDDQPQARVTGVSATPQRLDGQGLGTVFDELILGPPVDELIRDGYLSRVQIFAPAAAPDVRDLHTLAGDFSARDLTTLMDVPIITGDAVEHYGWHAPGQPAIAFCVSVKHAENTAAAFRAAGWRAVAVSGDMAVPDRDKALGGLATGAVEVVCSCALIDEGLDVPGVSCIIDLAPTKSLGKYLQRGGRGMRPAPGKSHMILLDHAGNTIRHGGGPDIARTWSLAGRPKGEKAAPVRQCSACYALHAPAPHCPACGFDYEAARVRAERREAERVAGELALLSPDDRRLKRLRGTPLAELVKGASFDELAEIGKARGYKPAWAYKQASFARPVRQAAGDGSEFMA